MKNLDLIRFFIRSFYRLPEQTFVQVMMILFALGMIFQVSGLESVLVDTQPVDRVISINILLTFIIMVLAMAYFVNSLLLRHDEYEQLVYLPIKEDEIIASKMVSSIVIPVGITLIVQVLAMFQLMGTYGWAVGVSYLGIMLGVMAVVAGVYFVQIGLVALFEKWFKSRAVYTIFYSLFIILTWGFFLLISLMRIGFNHFAPSTLKASFESMESLADWVDTLLLGIPFVEILQQLVVTDAFGRFIVGLVALILFTVICIIIAKVLLVKSYRINGQRQQRIETKATKDYGFSTKESLLYLQREHLLQKEHRHFLVQLYSTYSFPIIVAILLVFFKPFMEQTFNIPFLDTHFFMAFSYMMLIFVSTNNQVGTGYSKEGNLYASLKFMPFHEGKVYLAKARYLTIWTGITLLICFVIFTIGEGFRLLMIPLFIYFVLLSYAGYLVGLIPDSKKPITDWEKPTVAVKSNMNGLVGMLLMMLLVGLGMAAHIMGMVFGVNDYVFVFILIIVIAALVLLLERILGRNS